MGVTMVTYDQLSGDGQDFADESAEDFVSNTFTEDNFQKQANNSVAAANGEDGFVSATEALANKLGVSESDLDAFDSKYVSNTETAAERGKYEEGLRASGVDDEATWRDRWLDGLE